MGISLRRTDTMNGLFIQSLRDIHYVERRLVTSLQSLATKATDPQLLAAFELHLGETRNQIRRVEKIFEMLGADQGSGASPAIDGIIEEADRLARGVGDERVLNAGLIAAAQAAEHYEISRYGTLVSWAKQLGHNSCASVLEDTLREEKAADDILTKIAERKVNISAPSSA